MNKPAGKKRYLSPDIDPQYFLIICQNENYGIVTGFTPSLKKIETLYEACWNVIFDGMNGITSFLKTNRIFYHKFVRKNQDCMVFGHLCGICGTTQIAMNIYDPACFSFNFLEKIMNQKTDVFSKELYNPLIDRITVYNGWLMPN